jgi:uncharacterized protein YbaP (TraB family)
MDIGASMMDHRCTAVGRAAVVAGRCRCAGRRPPRLRGAAILLLCGWLGGLAPRDGAATPLPPPAIDAAVRLEDVLVSGEQPGPGLWRVERDGHVMWILGTQSPLPKRMRWRSTEAGQRLAESQILLGEPAVSFGAGIGRVRTLLLLPSLMAARRDPQQQSLQDALPVELYARFSALKARYSPRDRAVERMRPIIAAQRLYADAIDSAGLSHRNLAWRHLEKQARRQRVAVQRPEIVISIEAPRQAIRAFAAVRLDDIGCLERTIERLETDLEAMRQRANAWAIGDLDALRALPHPDNAGACRDAILQAELVQLHGLQDLPRRRADAWLAAAIAALAEHRSTFAVLPLQDLLRDDGQLERLRALGYQVVAPE